MTSTKKNLKSKILKKESKIGIFGLGYVGQPLFLRFSEKGYKVLGFDIDQHKVSEFHNGISTIEHIENKRVSKAIERGSEATNDFSRAYECDVLILCVPTPLNKYREPDMSYVLNTTDMIKPYVRKGQIVSLESTTYPGTTEELLMPRIEESGFVVGEDIFLIYSPEREDPANESFTTQTIPKVVGGCTESCLELGVALYNEAVDVVVPVSSTKTAELTKLLENIHRAVNIGLVNEMKVVADHMGIDIFEVIEAAATKPFGFTPYYPGPGLGGHCIPIDPFYLTWKAREYGLHTRFIELSGEVNRAMPSYVVDKLISGLNQQGKPLKDSRILILGIAYKKNVDDVRESPSVEIMSLIQKRGGIVHYSDPHVSEFPKMRAYDFDLSSQALTPKLIESYDALLIATDHDKFDYDMLLEHAQLIVDSRGRYRDSHSKIIKA